MKTDRRKCFMLVMGIIQILLGSLFLCVGSWAIMVVRPALYASGFLPFFLALIVSTVYKISLALHVFL
jgi:hypothetical protein